MSKFWTRKEERVPRPQMQSRRESHRGELVDSKELGIELLTMQTDAIMLQGPMATVVTGELDKTNSKMEIQEKHLMPLFKEFLKDQPENNINRVQHYFEKSPTYDLKLREQVVNLNESNGLMTAVNRAFWIGVEVYDKLELMTRFSIGNGFHIADKYILTARHLLVTKETEVLHNIVVSRDPNLLENTKAIQNWKYFPGRVFKVVVVNDGLLNEPDTESWEPVNMKIEDVRDVTLLRILDDSFPTAPFTIPSMLPFSENLIGQPIAVIGIPDQISSGLRHVEPFFPTLLVKSLNFLTDNERNSLLQRAFRFIVGKRQNVPFASIGSIIYTDNDFIITTAPTWRSLSGSAIVSLHNPDVVLGIIIGGLATGKSIGLGYKHPVFQQLFAKALAVEPAD